MTEPVAPWSEYARSEWARIVQRSQAAELATIRPLPMALRTERYAAGLASGRLTVNGIRANEGLDPLRPPETDEEPWDVLDATIVGTAAWWTVCVRGRRRRARRGRRCDRDAEGGRAMNDQEKACIFAPCVATWEHYHGGFPGGYDNPEDPTGPPIPFTGPNPDPGAVRDYNGAALAASGDTPRGLRLVHATAQGVAEAANIVIENNYAPDPSLTYDVLRWRQLVDAINTWREAQRTALASVSHPEEPTR